MQKGFPQIEGERSNGLPEGEWDEEGDEVHKNVK
jgi:hypothetical protein